MNKENILGNVYKIGQGLVTTFLTSAYTVFEQPMLKQWLVKNQSDSWGLFWYGITNSVIMAVLALIPFFIIPLIKQIWKLLKRFIKWCKKNILPIFIYVDYKILNNRSEEYSYDKSTGVVLFNNSEAIQTGFELEINISINNINKRKIKNLTTKDHLLKITSIPENLTFTSLNKSDMDQLFEINTLKGALECDVIHLYKNAKEDKDIKLKFECATPVIDSGLELQASSRHKFLMYTKGYMTFKVQCK